jgi:transposase-like protein
MTTALANIQGQLNPLKEVKAETILARYLGEESTKDIAKSLGVTRSALNYWLLEHAEKEWRSAQVIRAMRRKEDAEDAIETASDPLALARAREALKAAQWDLERVCRRIYGQDTPPDGAGRVSITLNIGSRPLDVVGEQIPVQISSSQVENK